MRITKKFLGIAIIALLMGVLATGTVWAAAAAEEKVGTVEPQRLIFEHPKYDQTANQIQSIYDKKNQEAKTAIDAEPDNNKKAEIYQSIRMAIAEEEQKLMQPIYKDIDIAIRTVANAKKITIIVEKASILYGGVDITNEVIQELNKMAASGN